MSPAPLPDTPPRPSASPPPARRRGTVLVVVIALLGALMLMGFLFLTLTLQEEQSGIHYADAAKTVEVDPNVLFNEALEQLIVGPDDSRRESVLYGSYKTMMAGMFGADLVPFDGTGVSTVWDGTASRPAPDLNRDGTAEATPEARAALRLTFAPGSQPEAIGTAAERTALRDYLANLRLPGVSGLPAPDADRTYPDLNNLFLSYDWVEPVTGARMVIPSWHRPQMLRNRIQPGDFLLDPNVPADWRDGGADGMTQIPPWYTEPETLPYVLRPHWERRAIATDPEDPSSFILPPANQPYFRRFISAAHPDHRPNAAGNAVVPVAPTDPDYVAPFDFRVDREPFMRVGVNDPDLTDVSYVYSPEAEYTYDADPDNDGVRDAIYLDLGYPAQRAGDGDGLYVPMWAFKVVDMGALFNLNAHGNSYGSFADANGDNVDDSLNLTGPNFVGGGTASRMISRSDHGLTQDEVNPQYGLSGVSTTALTVEGQQKTAAETYTAFSDFYDNLVPWNGTAQQSRNLEWWFLLHGRATFKDGRNGRVADDLLVGRYGERQRLERGATVMRGEITAQGSGPYVSTAAAYFPYPGLSAPDTGGDVRLLLASRADDDGNAFEGTAARLPGLVFGGFSGSGGGGLTMTADPEGVPLDRRGSGFYTDTVAGIQRVFLTQKDLISNRSPDPALGALSAGFGLRQRFPLLLNAILPVSSIPAPNGFPVAAGAGNLFGQVGDWATAYGSLFGGGVVARDERTDGDSVTVKNSMGTDVNMTTFAGVPGAALTGLLVNPDLPALFMQPVPGPGVTFLPSLYGALSGRADPLAQFNRLAVDEPGETIRDFEKANGQRSDAIYGPSETIALHLSDADRRISGAEGRLLELVPVSFLHAPHARAVRRRFTTASFDVTTAAVPFEPPAVRSPGFAQRNWEFSQTDLDGDGNREQVFPPTFGADGTDNGAYGNADPFRAEVRALLTNADRLAEIQDALNTANVNEALDPARRLRGLVRKLSLNGVLERVTNPDDPLFDATVDLNDDGTDDGEGELRIRPLTPHPRGLSATPVDPPTGHPAGGPGAYEADTGDIPRFGLPDSPPAFRVIAGTAVSLRNAAIANPSRGLLTWDFPAPPFGDRALQLQEWHARRDRQNLARDLFVLLYVVGGVDEANPTKNFTTTAYAADEVRELAQLAVNIVDAMDTDPVRTLFVYDKDLSDGYTPLDDGYANRPDPTDTVRGLVVGVERQDLALSEVLVNLAWAEQSASDDSAADHPLTEWRDDQPTDFFFAELAYTGPGVLDFADNAAVTGGAGAPLPGENWRLVVRDPRDARQFRETPTGGTTPSGVDVITDRVVIPRAGSVSADRPYFTIASADPSLALTQDGIGVPQPRSRIRVNFQDPKGSANPDTTTSKWYDLAPRPFAPFAVQNAPVPPIGDPDPAGGVVTRPARNNPARILDLLVPPDPGSPAFRLQNVEHDVNDRVLLTEAGLVDPGNVADHDLFVIPNQEDAKARPPVVEVLLQTRANPLRRPNDAMQSGGNVTEQEDDNPWITVDRMRAVTTRLDLFADHDNAPTAPTNGGGPNDQVPGGQFALHFQDDLNGARTIDGPLGQTGPGTNALPKVASRVRRRPLLRASEVPGYDRTVTPSNYATDERSMLSPSENPARQNYNGDADAAPAQAVVFNSLGGHDRTSPQVFTGAGTPDGPSRPLDLWQPHFDRPFAGPADIAMVPLYDAEHLTGLTDETDRVFGAGGSGITVGGTGMETADQFKDLAGVTGTVERQVGLGFDPTPQVADDGGVGGFAVLNRLNAVASRLLYPDVPRTSWQGSLDPGATPMPRFNMWYRLLQYADTPRHTAEMTSAQPFTVRLGPTARLETDSGFDTGNVRRAGRLNLNTLADPVHLAGLMDDLGRVHAFPVGTNGEPTGSGRVTTGLPVTTGGFTPAGADSLVDAAGDAFNDDFYRSLLLSRDGLDPLPIPGTWDPTGSGNTRLVLPGIADRGLAAGGGRDSYPFGGYHAPTRELTASVNTNIARSLRDAIQRTPLRARPQTTPWIDNAGATDHSTGVDDQFAMLPRAFFGVGGELLSADPAADRPDVDFTTRYRLLNKALNSATHRSNTFLCYIQVDFFDAREIPLRALLPDSAPEAAKRRVITRIGAKRGDSPGFRGAFLIDRSLAVGLLRADHLPELVNPDDSATLNGDETRTYSFARDPLSGGVKFPWQDLVISRQRIQ